MKNSTMKKDTFIIFFNHGNNNLPRVYPIACNPDIPITCDLAGAETSRWGRLPFKPCHNRPNEQPYPPSVLTILFIFMLKLIYVLCGMLFMLVI